MELSLADWGRMALALPAAAILIGLIWGAAKLTDKMQK